MSDTQLDREFFVTSRLQKAHQFARLRAKRGVLSLSLSLATGLVFLSASVALAAHFDVPNGIQAFTQTSVQGAQALVRGTLDGTQTAPSHVARQTQQTAAAAFSAGAGASEQGASSASEYFHSLWSRVADTLAASLLSIANAIPGNTVLFSRNADSAQSAPAALAFAEPAQSPQIVSATSSVTTSTGSTSSPQASSGQATVVNNYITQPVIERTVQTALPLSSGYVTQAELANQLNALSNTFSKTIYGTTYPAPATSYASGGVFNAIALSNKIDNLFGTKLSSITVSGVSGLTDADIPDGITASNYLALTGGTLSGALTIPYLAATSTTATSTFAAGVQATYLNLTGTAATSTAANGFNLSAGCFAVNGTCVTGGGGASLSVANTWTALQLFSAGASSTQLSVFTKAYFGGTATSTFDSAGNLSVAGTASVTGATTLGNFTATNGTTTNATSTNLAVTGTASTSALVASNSFTFSNVTGFLKAVAGAVTTALINLASDVTGILPVGNGGTGATSLTGLVKGNGTSAFTAASAGTDYVAPVTTITAGTGLSGGGDLSANRTLTLNLANANAWTGLQTFANSSSTLASVFNTLYVGGTATSTIQGNTTGTSTIQGFLNVAGTNSTSTFSGALASTYLNLTGTAATSTAANGFNLSAGCFAVNGTCVGGSSSQWTTSGSNIYYTTGSVFIGTTTPGRTFTVFNTAANAQQRISYDATRYAEFYVDASGDLQLSATGKNLRALDANLYLCDGGACPTTPVQGYPSSFTGNGNAVVAGTIYADGFGPATCPTGMIPVPASPADGQQGFCVDKYEAQSSADNEVSVQGGSPWVSITQTSARAECIRAGKHLITEKEWQAIAHNAENVGWNWNGGVAGTNQMSDGHSDNAPASALATAVDTDPCNGTGQTCDTSTWSSQRRTYKLSNGGYIWDFGGNVWEWVDQVVVNDYPIVNSATAGWQACSTSGDGICGNTRTTNDQWYRGGFATIAGFGRGGDWGPGAPVGAFALNLSSAPSGSDAGAGFRCSR